MVALADHICFAAAGAVDRYSVIGIGSASMYVAIAGHLPEVFRGPFDLVSVRRHELFIGQGTQDDVTPVESVLDTVQWLRDSGLKPEYREFEMGHRPSDECVAAAMKWIGHIGPGFRSS